MDSRNFDYTALKLCVILVFVYSLQVFTGFEPGFNASESEWWKFFTSFLGHSDLQHLINNLFFIGLFGSLLELYTSRRVFVKVFLVSAIFANFSAFVFFTDSFIIGASGGGMGLMAALAVYRPRSVGLGLGVPVPMWAALIMYVVIDFAGMSTANNVANEAHLLGILAGSIIGYNLRDKPYKLNSGSGNKKDNEFSDWEKRIREWEEEYMFN